MSELVVNASYTASACAVLLLLGLVLDYCHQLTLHHVGKDTCPQT